MNAASPSQSPQFDNNRTFDMGRKFHHAKKINTPQDESDILELKLRCTDSLSKILSVSGESTEKYITDGSKPISPKQIMRKSKFRRPS